MLGYLGHGLEFHGPDRLDTEQLLLGVRENREANELYRLLIESTNENGK